jgi:hypothetical protein
VREFYEVHFSCANFAAMPFTLRNVRFLRLELRGAFLYTVCATRRSGQLQYLFIFNYELGVLATTTGSTE